jgi:cytochrome c-type biogenesis protein CcmH
MFGKGRVLAVLLAGLPLVGACDKKSEPAKPVPSAGLPPLDDKGLAAPLGEHPEHAPTAANPHEGMNLPPGHPSLPGAGEPEGATPGDIPFDPKTVVSGTLQLDPKVKSQVKEGDVIYLVARAADQPGPPLAVKRMVAGKFPMSFELDGRDAMMAGTKLAGKVTINVRVDKDGDAMTKNPGDVTGQKTVELPAQKIVLNLDTVL